MSSHPALETEREQCLRNSRGAPQCLSSSASPARASSISNFVVIIPLLFVFELIHMYETVNNVWSFAYFMLVGNCTMSFAFFCSFLLFLNTEAFRLPPCWCLQLWVITCPCCVILLWIYLSMSVLLFIGVWGLFLVWGSRSFTSLLCCAQSCPTLLWPRGL